MHSYVIPALLTTVGPANNYDGNGFDEVLHTDTSVKIADSSYASLAEILRSSSSYALANGIYVCCVRTEWLGLSSPAFCAIKLSRWHSLAMIWVGFYNVCVADRKLFLAEIERVLTSPVSPQLREMAEPSVTAALDETETGSGSNAGQPRSTPISTQEGSSIEKLSACSLLQNNVAMLISRHAAEPQAVELIAKNVHPEGHIDSFGSRTSYTWQLATDHDTETAVEVEGSIISAGIEHLRLRDGFKCVKKTSSTSVLLREFEVNCQRCADNACGTCVVIYSVSTSHSSRTVTTEIWVEPVYGVVRTDSVAKFKGCSTAELFSMIVVEDERFVSAACTYHTVASIGVSLPAGVQCPPTPELGWPSHAGNPFFFDPDAVISSSVAGAVVAVDVPFNFDITSLLEYARTSIDVTLPGFSAPLTAETMDMSVKRPSESTSDGGSPSSTQSSNSSREPQSHYVSTADFRQSLLVALLRQACDLEIPLTSAACATISKLIPAPSSVERFHCFATNYNETIVLTIVTSPRVSRSQATFGGPNQSSNTGIDEHTVIRFFECQKIDVFDHTSANDRPIQSDHVDWNFSQNRLCNVVEAIPDTSPHSNSLNQHIEVLVELYIKSYVEAIFRCLQLRRSVMIQDVHNARDVCESVDEEIDLTELFQVLLHNTRDVAPGLQTEDHKEDMKRRFQGILKYWFRQVPTDPELWYLVDRKISEVLSFGESTVNSSFTTVASVSGLGSATVAPSSAPARSASLAIPRANGDNQESDTGEVDDNGVLGQPRGSLFSPSLFHYGLFQDIIGLSQVDEDANTADTADDMEMAPDPMFVTLECSLRRLAKGGSPLYISKAVTELPVSVLDFFDHDDANADELVDGILKGSILLMLHVTVHVLRTEMPWQDVDDRNEDEIELLGPQFAEHDTSDFADAASSTNEVADEEDELSVNYTSLRGDCDYSDEDVLTQRQSKVFTRISEEIKWLLEDELTSLKRADNKFSEAVISEYVRHISQATTVPSNSLIQYLDLRFVRAEGRAMFTEELSFERLNGYSMRKVGKYLYLSANAQVSTGSSNLSNDGSTVLPHLLLPEPAVPEVWVPKTEDPSP